MCHDPIHFFQDVLPGLFCKIGKAGDATHTEVFYPAKVGFIRLKAIRLNGLYLK
jgi:hypothetical protein